MSAFVNKMPLATDGSPDAESAARMSITLSNGLNLELHVVCMGCAPSVYTQPVVRRVRQGDMHYSSRRILPANRPISEARPAGFEPATRGLEVRCSVLLSYGRNEQKCCKVAHFSGDSNAPRCLMAAVGQQ